MLDHGLSHPSLNFWSTSSWNLLQFSTKFLVSADSWFRTKNQCHFITMTKVIVITAIKIDVNVCRTFLYILVGKIWMKSCNSDLGGLSRNLYWHLNGKMLTLLRLLFLQPSSFLCVCLGLAFPFVSIYLPVLVFCTSSCGDYSYVCSWAWGCTRFSFFVRVFVWSCMCLCVGVCLVCSQLQAGYFKLVATVPLRFGWLKAPSA